MDSWSPTSTDLILWNIWRCGTSTLLYPCLRVRKLVGLLVPMYTKGSNIWIFRELNDWHPGGARQRQRQQNNQWNSTSTRMLQCLHQPEPEIRMAEGMQGTACPWTQSKTCFIAGSAWAGSSISSVPRRACPWPAATAPAGPAHGSSLARAPAPCHFQRSLCTTAATAPRPPALLRNLAPLA
jgi:hypothetical protein